MATAKADLYATKFEWVTEITELVCGARLAVVRLLFRPKSPNPDSHG